MKKPATLVIAAVLITACQDSSTVRENAGHNNFVQLQGSTLVLNQALDVAPERSRVFVQDGKVRYGFNSYKPHCAFEIDSIRHQGAQILADRFAIVRVQQTLNEVVMHTRVQVAALPMVADMGDGGGSPSLYAGYHFWLASENQPQVRRMTCYGVFAQPYELEPPTVAEIRATLGKIASLD